LDGVGLRHVTRSLKVSHDNITGRPPCPALQAFERALEIDPHSTDAKIGIARVLVGKLSTGRSSSSFQQEGTLQDEARVERLLVEVIEGDPNQSMAYATIGMLRRMQVRLAESRIALRRQSHSIQTTTRRTDSSLGRYSFWPSPTLQSLWAKGACG
jgi:hypothetical protein